MELEYLKIISFALIMIMIILGIGLSIYITKFIHEK